MHGTFMYQRQRVRLPAFSAAVHDYMLLLFHADLSTASYTPLLWPIASLCNRIADVVGRQIVLAWPMWRPSFHNSRLQHSYRSWFSHCHRWENTSFSRKSPKNVKVLRCHAGHTTILHHLLPSAVPLRMSACILNVLRVSEYLAFEN